MIGHNIVLVVGLPSVSEVVRLRTLGLLRVPSLPAIGQQVPSGSVREVDPFGATVVLFTFRFHIDIIDAQVG